MDNGNPQPYESGYLPEKTKRFRISLIVEAPLQLGCLHHAIQAAGLTVQAGTKAAQQNTWA